MGLARDRVPLSPVMGLFDSTDRTIRDLVGGVGTAKHVCNIRCRTGHQHAAASCHERCRDGGDRSSRGEGSA